MTRVFFAFLEFMPGGKKGNFFRIKNQAYNLCGFLSMQRKEVKKMTKFLEILDLLKVLQDIVSAETLDARVALAIMSLVLTVYKELKKNVNNGKGGICPAFFPKKRA